MSSPTVFAWIGIKYISGNDDFAHNCENFALHKGELRLHKTMSGLCRTDCQTTISYTIGKDSLFVIHF